MTSKNDKKNAKNILQKERFKTEYDLFYLICNSLIFKSFNYINFIKLVLLVFYICVEYYAALRVFEQYGENIDFILPILGTILNLMTGLYRGLVIEYQEICTRLSKKYQNFLKNLVE